MDNSSIALSCIVVVLTYIAYTLLNWAWLRPLRLEKFLKRQGFKGNPYKLMTLFGDQKENSKVMEDALSRPIGFDDDISPRVMPLVYNNAKKHGKMSFLWLGRVPKVQILSPALAKEALYKHSNFQKNFSALHPITKYVFSGLGSYEGEKWAKYRKLMDPAFKMDKLKEMIEASYSASVELVEEWGKRVGPKGFAEVDVQGDLEMFSASVLSQSLFGRSNNENEKIFEIMREQLKLTMQAAQSVYIPGTRFLPSKRDSRIKELNKVLEAEIMIMINGKKQAMSAGKTKSGEFFLSSLLASEMSSTDIMNECRLLFFAGKDTSSALLIWGMILLAKHTKWQELARKEVMDAFGDKKPEWDGLNHLKILTMIMYEVLRLYPPIVELSRSVHEDSQLGDLTIPAGVQVQVPIMMLQRDPEIWGDDVLEFNPERFAGGVVSATNIQGSYIPFSLGPRFCIGQNFAILEIKVAFATILSHYSFEVGKTGR